jgi:hypothetical protein
LKGSIQDVANQYGGTALALLKARMILLCDRSGSMTIADAMHGKKRYEVEDRVINDLQSENPGQIIIIAFAESAILCVNGELPYPDGDATVFSNAFQLAAKLIQRDMRVVLLTDGEATDPKDVIFNSVKPLRGRLDIVYIGSDHGAGRGFLEELAKSVSGTYQRNKLEAAHLLDTLEKLLLKPGAK